MTTETFKTIFAVLGVVNTICFLGFITITWWAGRGRREKAARQIGGWR